MTATTINAAKSDVSILILNEKSWSEHWCVTLPQSMEGNRRKRAEMKLDRAGFRDSYKFDQRVTDKRSLTLAKAQASAIAKRIENRTGVKMEVAHCISVSGK